MGDWDGTLIPPVAGGLARASQMAALFAKAEADISAMSTYTATVANITAGSTAIETRYRRVGNKFSALFSFIFSAGASVGTQPAWDLPPGMTLHASYVASAVVSTEVYLLDATTTIRHGYVEVVDSNTLRIGYYSAAHTPDNITSSAPWTWTTNDRIWAKVTGLELAA